jgi:hypothetical protein
MDPKTHDFSGDKNHWGHSYIFNPVNGGTQGLMSGFGEGIRVGDFLILENKGKTTRYMVDEIFYYPDPGDMWSAKVSFAPRSKTDTDNN